MTRGVAAANGGLFLPRPIPVWCFTKRADHRDDLGIARRPVMAATLTDVDRHALRELAHYRQRSMQDVPPGRSHPQITPNPNRVTLEGAR